MYASLGLNELTLVAHMVLVILGSIGLGNGLSPIGANTLPKYLFVKFQPNKNDHILPTHKIHM